MTQDELLEAVWREIINQGMDGKWIPKLLKQCDSDPDAPFADVGPVLQRMLDKKVSKEDICRLMRSARYDACFDLLFRLEEEPLPPDEFEGIHESLLSADPSGLEGRPGSWPIAKKKSVSRQPRPNLAFTPLLTDKRSFSFTFSPSGKYVAASGGGRIWDIHSGSEIAKCKLYPNTTELEFSPDETRLAAINTSGIVAVFDVSTGERALTYKTGCEGNIVLFSPDGRFVLAANWAGKLFIWHANDGREFLQRDFGGDKIRSVGFTKQGNCVLVLRQSGMLTQHCLSVWDASVSAEQSRLQFKQPCDEIWLESQELELALFSEKNRIWLCKLPSEQVVAELPGVLPRAAAFSPDGKWVVVVTSKEFVVLGVPSLQVAARRPCEYANHVAFSRDGSLIGLASWKAGEIWQLSDLLQSSQE